MSEKALAIIGVNRPAFMRTIMETLVFTPDRVIVARTGKDLMVGGVIGGAVGAGVEAVIKARKKKTKEQEWKERVKIFFELPLEDILKADKHNFAIPNSEITKVERKSRLRFHITTSKKKYKWYSGVVISDPKMVASGDIPWETDWKDPRLFEDYENVLRPIFGDKLSVKK